MSTQRQHSSTHRAASIRSSGAAAALLLSIGLVGCAAAQPPTATHAGDAIPLPQNGDLDAGTYLVTSYPVPFEITVPDGWGISEGRMLDSDGVLVLFSNPTSVPSDACAWSGTLTEVDRSVAGFTDAMAAAAATATTAPVEVMSGDFQGVEFDLSVESDVAIDDCSQSHVCIHGSGNHCSRYYNAVDISETYHVFDLDGDRAVISLSLEYGGVDPAMVEEANAVFDSIRFLPDE